MEAALVPRDQRHEQERRHGPGKVEQDGVERGVEEGHARARRGGAARRHPRSGADAGLVLVTVGTSLRPYLFEMQTLSKTDGSRVL